MPASGWLRWSASRQLLLGDRPSNRLWPRRADVRRAGHLATRRRSFRFPRDRDAVRTSKAFYAASTASFACDGGQLRRAAIAGHIGALPGGGADPIEGSSTPARAAMPFAKRRLPSELRSRCRRMPAAR